MGRLLVHLSTGSEHPTRAALAMLDRVVSC